MSWVELIEIVAPGVARVRYHDYTGRIDDAVWSLGKLRKNKKCIVTEQQMRPGMMAWHPVGNQSYRGERISEYGMALMEQVAQQRGSE